VAYSVNLHTRLDLDNLDWQPIEKLLGSGEDVTDHASGAMACLLAHNPETGAMSYVARIPPGARSTLREAHSFDQQNLILEGECTTDLDTEPISLTPGSYRMIPAGVFHGPFYSEGGWTVLEITNGPFDIYYEEKPSEQ
jgi:mannose-6-phosphate isomerase-like protein (cupin superfamily)